MNVLAIGAHPDDIEYLCAGTLARYADEGADIFMAVATNGNVGSPDLSKSEIAAIRQQEAQNAASILGAELIWLDIDDEWLLDSEATRRLFIDAIRMSDPDVMFVHSEVDYHPDHRNAGRVALDARIPASVRLVESDLPPSRIPHVFVMDTLAGINFQPELYVDISSTIETKSAMLSCHQSQDAWISDLYGQDYVEIMQCQGRFRGLQFSVRFAEAFRSVRTFPRTGDQSLLPGGRSH